MKFRLEGNFSKFVYPARLSKFMKIQIKSFGMSRPGMFLLWALFTVVLLPGCRTTDVGLPDALPDRDQRIQRGYIFYLDGAGGGTAEKNWAGGVAEGMREGGYKGAGEMVSWETGEGLLADQTASVAFKKSKARKVSKKIIQYQKEYPGAPVHLLGFSAGTGEAIYALEELPLPAQVHNVVLLGTSISRHHDMTEALKRVKGKVYVFLSQHDGMIGLGSQIMGTTDRKRHDASAGIKGFSIPEGASQDTIGLYREKLINIPYSKDYRKDGNKGHHFDNVKEEFIRDYVAQYFPTR